MYLATLLVTIKNWKQPNIYQQENGQTMVTPYNGISCEKEWTTDTSNCTDESPKHYSKQRKPTTKLYSTKWFPLYELLEKANRICGDGGQGWGRWITAEQQEETLGVDGKALYLDYSGHFPSVYIVKTRHTVHFIFCITTVNNKNCVWMANRHKNRCSRPSEKCKLKL